MKRKRRARPPERPHRTVPPGPSATHRRRPSPRWFRWAAAVLVPILVLTLLEGGLRLFGYGYPTSFFLEETRGEKVVLVPNDRFGWRFFPPAIARSPTPALYPRDKTPDTFRIFLLGESAALGDPRPGYGMARQLEVLLEERYPGRGFQVIPAAMTAINSHALRLIARDCRRYQGDLWILYLGNNEMAGPFGANPLIGPQSPPLALVRASLALRATRVGQVLEALFRRLRPGAAPTQWLGMGMFQEHLLNPDDPARAGVYRNFQQNVSDILDLAGHAEIPAIVCTVAVNLLDCPPFASQHGTAFSTGRAAEWASVLASAAPARTNGFDLATVTALRVAATLDPRYAEIRHLLGLAELAGTNRPAAKPHLMAAVDADALPFRADSSLNDILRREAAARAARGVSLLDLERALGGDLDSGPPGHDAFFDHVHFNFEGNERVARLMAVEVERRLSDRLAGQPTREWPSSEIIARRLGWTAWNRRLVLGHMVQRLLEAPFTNQFNHLARLTFYANQVAGLQELTHPRNVLDAEEAYQEAIARRPEDRFLRENFAEFLETTENPNAALDQWRVVANLLPGYPLGWYHLGRLHSRLGQFAEAIRYLNRCLDLRTDLDEARLELAQALYRDQQLAAALAELDRLAPRLPNDPRVPRHRADVLAALGRRAEAVTNLQAAVRIRPADWDARYLLGVELAMDGQLVPAREQFAEVIRLRPDHLLAHLNLGVALVRLGQLDGAQAEFDRVLELDPGNARALQHLDALNAMRNRARKP